MYPNSGLVAWQLALIAVVAVASLAVWLTAVFLAAREPSYHAREASAVSDVATHDDRERPGHLAA